MKTIKVRANGEISVKPNTIELSLQLNIFNKSYATVVSDGTEKYNKLSNLVKKLNIDWELKTSNFSIDTKMENIRGEDGQYSLKQSGYTLNHNMLLTFSFDLTLLSTILMKISETDINPLINIKFTTDSISVYSEQAKELAVAKAMANAENLAKYSHSNLKEIVTIEYAETNLSPYSKTDFSPMLMRASVNYDDMTPMDLKISESIIITYEIE